MSAAQAAPNPSQSIDDKGGRVYATRSAYAIAPLGEPPPMIHDIAAALSRAPGALVPSRLPNTSRLDSAQSLYVRGVVRSARRGSLPAFGTPAARWSCCSRGP